MTKDITIGLKVAVILILIMLLYMAAVTFLPMPSTGEKQANTIVPFLLGIVATLVGFYWGNSSKRDKDIPVIPPDAGASVSVKKDKKADT